MDGEDSIDDKMSLKVLLRVQWRKVEVWWDMLQVEVNTWVKIWENTLFKCNGSILHSNFWFEVNFFPWEVVSSILVENLVFVLSHISSPLIIQMKMVKMRLKESKFGAYINSYGRRVAHYSLKYWLETLKFIIGPFTLSPINDQLQYPQWKANIFGIPHWIEMKYWACVINTPREGTPFVSCQSMGFKVVKSRVKDKG